MCIYYYTDFETFKLILKNGTLRFKESTSSNDIKDTKLLFERFVSVASERIKKIDKSEKQLEFVVELLSNKTYQNRRVSLVSCFTEKSDSRLLWDAYTMNRNGRESQRYNGVCIEFNQDELVNMLNNQEKMFDWIQMEKIQYGYKELNELIGQCIQEFNEVYNYLKKDQNQGQSLIPPVRVQILSKIYEFSWKKSIAIPTLNILDIFEKYSPFYKHEFWSEEAETRALLSIRKNTTQFEKIPVDNNGAHYWDIDINSKCIRKIILGPEFNKSDKKSLDKLNGKIKYSDLKKVNSLGKGVITNR